MAGTTRRFAHVAMITWITLWISVVPFVDGCPGGCTCTVKNSGPEGQPQVGRKVICSGLSLTGLSQLSTFPINTLQLDLSQNALTTVERGAFRVLATLQRLDLSHNEISRLEPGAFLGLESLIKLDLSRNKLGSINSTIFEGMPKLEKLSLTGNELKTIPEGTFAALKNLNRIDFASAYLICDCRMEWIVRWIKTTKVKVSSSSVCAVPTDLKGKSIKSLKRKDLHCNWPVELPRFELTPNSNQVVFEGDKLPFGCRASIIDPSTVMYWVRKGEPVSTNRSRGLMVLTQLTPDHTEMTASLIVSRLTVTDSGIWECFVQTSRGNVSKTVNIVVMSEDTLYCPPVVSETMKGVFSWPKTVSGVRVDVQCPHGGGSGYKGSGPAHAFHTCNSQGRWEKEDITQCQFESEVTRVLEQYAKADLSNLTRVVSRADQLKGYVINSPEAIKHKMDIIFLARIIESFSQQVKDNEKLSDIILHIVSIIMDTKPQVLAEAQMEQQACTRMVRAVEELPKQLLSEHLHKVSKHAANIALHAYTVQARTFQGYSCAAFQPLPPQIGYNEHSLYCMPQHNVSHKANPTKVMADRKIEAFTHVPGSVFRGVKCDYPVCADNTFMLQFIVYRNATLFPVLSRHQEGRQEGRQEDRHEEPWRVASSVVSIKIGVPVVDNLTDPIVISLRTRTTRGRKMAAYWDSLMQDGWGGWDTTGCSLVKEEGNISTMECSHMTNYAVVQAVVSVTPGGRLWYHYMFTLPPAVYSGSCILMLCTLAVLCTIGGCHRDLKMPRKAKHSVANFCLSLFLLTFTFTLGVRMTVHVLACQIIGIAIHYFSICTFFWLLITSYNMYKKFLKAERPVAPPIEPLEGPPLPKPMLRFYLIGWGITIIICGITAAVNLNYYSDQKPYCFLSMEPSVGAIIVPSCILIFINIIFFVCISCVVRGSAGAMLDEPETEEINELELTNQEIESLPPSHLLNLTAGTSLMDLEYRPACQLYAVVAVLVLYILTWVGGALVVALPFPGVIPHQETIFTYVYAVCSATLGVFLLVFYCLGREDARDTWRKCLTCDRPQSYSIPGAGHHHLTHMNGHIANSHTSLNSSFTNKSNNTNQSQHVRYGPKKTSNVNLVPSHPATITEASVSTTQENNIPLFFNPRQNGIAKKYWEKHRQRNHVSLLRSELGGDLCLSGHHSPSITGNSRQSYQGNSSDANTHLSIEIQIKSRPRSGAYSPKLFGPEAGGYNSLPRSQRSGYAPLTLHTNNTPLLAPVVNPANRSQVGPPGGVHMFDRNSASPAGIHGVDPTYESAPSSKTAGSGEGVNVITPHINGYCMQPSSVPVYPALPPPPSYAYPSNSVNNGAGLLGGGSNNSLPRPGPQGKNLNQFMERNGSVPRLRDFDGQSQVSSNHAHHELPRQEHPLSVSSDIQSMEMYRPPEPPIINISPQNRQDTGDPVEDPLDDSTVEGDEVRTCTAGGSECGTNSSRRRKKESFMDQLEQRIPHNKMGSSPALSRSTLGGSLDRAMRDRNRPLSMGSENSQHSQRSQSHSENDSHPQRSRSYDSHRSRDSTRSSHESQRSHESRRPQRGKRTSRSLPSKHKLKWDGEMAERPKQPSYVYVNHSYQDKVMSKLLQQNPNGLVEPLSRGLSWFPRSVSAYEQVANVDLRDDDDDESTSSSSDDSTDDIWVLQKRKKRKFKKETSV